MVKVRVVVKVGVKVRADIPFFLHVLVDRVSVRLRLKV